MTFFLSIATVISPKQTSAVIQDYALKTKTLILYNIESTNCTIFIK